MCIVIVKPADVPMVPFDILEECELGNANGMGYMYPDARGVHIRKGFFKVEDLWNDMTRHEVEDKPLVIHFRFATHGKKDKGNCHPFPLSIEKKKLRSTQLHSDVGIAHNGILSVTPEDKDLSDTMQFIIDNAEHLDLWKKQGNGLQALFNTAISGNKFAVMLKDGEIVLHGYGWIKDNNVYYSNSGYKRVRVDTRRWTYDGTGFSTKAVPKAKSWRDYMFKSEKKDDKEEVPDYYMCEWCGAWQSGETGWCESCGEWLDIEGEEEEPEVEEYKGKVTSYYDKLDVGLK